MLSEAEWDRIALHETLGVLGRASAILQSAQQLLADLRPELTQVGHDSALFVPGRRALQPAAEEDDEPHEPGAGVLDLVQRRAAATQQQCAQLDRDIVQARAAVDAARVLVRGMPAPGVGAGTAGSGHGPAREADTGSAPQEVRALGARLVRLSTDIQHLADTLTRAPVNWLVVVDQAVDLERNLRSCLHEAQELAARLTRSATEAGRRGTDSPAELRHAALVVGALRIATEAIGPLASTLPTSQGPATSAAVCVPLVARFVDNARRAVCDLQRLLPREDSGVGPAAPGAVD